MPITLADTRPATIGEAQHRLALGPGTQNDERGSALPQPGTQARDARIARALGRPGNHDAEHIGDRRGDTEPVFSGMWHQDKPLEVDAEALGCLHPKLGDADDTAPRTGRRGTREHGHEQGRRIVYGVGHTLFETAAG